MLFVLGVLMIGIGMWRFIVAVSNNRFYWGWVLLMAFGAAILQNM